MLFLFLLLLLLSWRCVVAEEKQDLGVDKILVEVLRDPPAADQNCYIMSACNQKVLQTHHLFSQLVEETHGLYDVHQQHAVREHKRTTVIAHQLTFKQQKMTQTRHRVPHLPPEYVHGSQQQNTTHKTQQRVMCPHRGGQFKHAYDDMTKHD